jgi:predicted metal-dependent hydrolase
VAERPRDRLGRPLAPDAVGFPGVEQRESITSCEAVAEATAYLDQGLPFHAHEVLEMRWRCCPADERVLWRGLAQAAAGATHAARGNPVGASRLIARGQVSIEEYAGPVDDATRSLINSLTAPRGASDV